MQVKQVKILVLLLSAICLCGGILIMVRDLIFFITKKEANATVLSIETNSSGYRIRLSYFNQYNQSEITTSVKLKNSYKSKFNDLKGSISVYYSKFFPKHVYVKDIKVIKKGIILFEIIFILILTLALKFGLEGLKNNVSLS